MTGTTMAFTGHRPHKLGLPQDENHPSVQLAKNTMAQLLRSMVRHQDVRRVISGMALGCDIWISEMTLALQREYPDLVLECAIPYVNQTEKWGKQDQQQYLPRYQKILATEGVQQHHVPAPMYSTEVFNIRNQYMVDKSDYLFAVWNGSPSGTGNTVHMAKSQGMRCLIYYPFSDKIESDFDV